MAPSYEELGLALENFIKKNVEGKSVGVAFSGGMDSGIVAAVAAKYARSVTKTFLHFGVFSSGRIST